MKFLHLSDLHLGIRVNGFSMLDDQQYILKQIINIADKTNADAVIIAGDVYDKSVPSAEAVQLFDDFLYTLKTMNLKVFVIGGNHDSMERLSFGSRLMEKSNIYISPVYNGTLKPLTAEDEHGKVCIYMLPFIKPANVRRYYPDEDIQTYNDAVKVALSKAPVDEKCRNILVTHQFVTGASVCESEEITVGGTDNIDASLFDSFDYVALGHIHGPQSILKKTVTYSGTPLKYSFSEKNHIKSVNVVSLGEKGDVKIQIEPLVPKHDMREIKGTYNELTLKSNYEGTNTDDYMSIILTDEEDVPDAIGRLRTVYPNIMKLNYDNARTRNSTSIKKIESIKSKSFIELFEEFYEKQNASPMSEIQKKFVKNLDREIRGDE